ncbi:hypothetical protein BJX61DRAFT_496890, partial [Aspergillus egyptiacus]
MATAAIHVIAMFIPPVSPYHHTTAASSSTAKLPPLCHQLRRPMARANGPRRYLNFFIHCWESVCPYRVNIPTLESTAPVVTVVC